MGEDEQFHKFSQREDMADRWVAVLQKQILNNDPIHFHHLQRYIDNDPIYIAEGHYLYIKAGWPSSLKDAAIKPFFSVSASSVGQR
jgi:hypothetical protein